MQIRSYRFIWLAFMMMLFIGCTTSGVFLSLNQTQVQLSEPNYHIVAIDVQGEAKAAYLLGISHSFGAEAQTVALFRVSGTGLLYKEALEDLWLNYERKHGSAVGRKLALVNVRYDSDILNLILYTEVKVIVRADIVEFRE